MRWFPQPTLEPSASPVCSGCQNESSVDRVADAADVHFSPCWGLDVRGGGVPRVRVWEGPSAWFTELLSCCILPWWGESALVPSQSPIWPPSHRGSPPYSLFSTQFPSKGHTTHPHTESASACESGACGHPSPLYSPCGTSLHCRSRRSFFSVVPLVSRMLCDRPFRYIPSF